MSQFLRIRMSKEIFFQQQERHGLFFLVLAAVWHSHYIGCCFAAKIRTTSWYVVAQGRMKDFRLGFPCVRWSKRKRDGQRKHFSLLRIREKTETLIQFL